MQWLILSWRVNFFLSSPIPLPFLPPSCHLKNFRKRNRKCEGNVATDLLAKLSSLMKPPGKILLFFWVTVKLGKKYLAFEANGNWIFLILKPSPVFFECFNSENFTSALQIMCWTINFKFFDFFIAMRAFRTLSRKKKFFSHLFSTFEFFANKYFSENTLKFSKIYFQFFSRLITHQIIESINYSYRKF